jgi:hypothetical protein
MPCGGSVAMLRGMATEHDERRPDRTCKILAIFLTVFIIATVTLLILAVASGFMVIPVGFPGLRDHNTIRILPTFPGYLP